MKQRDTALRAKRFETTEKARKVTLLETMVQDFENLAADLARQIAAEEERTGVKDPAHFSYSTFAKAAAQRRGNLLASLADLKAKLDAAKRDHEESALELKKLEPASVENRDADHTLVERDRAMLG
jgi:flagellar FliJ protein